MLNRNVLVKFLAIVVLISAFTGCGDPANEKQNQIAKSDTTGINNERRHGETKRQRCYD